MGDLSTKDRQKVVAEKGEHAVYSETEIVKAKVVVSCVGGLVEPNAFPKDIPGLENFKGKMFHSARWDQTADFNDKNVVVVGTGCSAAQLVPCLPEAPYNAKSVTQLMRTPPWIPPQATPPGGNEWWEKNSPALLKSIPGLQKLLRFVIFAGAEVDFQKLFPNNEYSAKHSKIYADRVLGLMRERVPEKYWDIMTPDYGPGCKRRIFERNWSKSLHHPKIELTTQPFTRVTETGVIIGPGLTYPKNAKEEDYPEREIPADVIVLANGFETTRWLHPLRVAGKGGKDLIQVMEDRGGSQAYQGTAMDGFPNFFMIFGPNTATGHTSVIMTSESKLNLQTGKSCFANFYALDMVDHALKFVKLILNGDATTVDVKHEAEVAFTADIQAALKNSVWGDCMSWYVAEDGWNSTTYPYSQIDFWRRCQNPTWDDWNIAYTSKGIAKIRNKKIMRALMVGLAIVGTYKVKQSGKSVKVLLAGLLQNLLGRFMQVLMRLNRR